MTRSYSIPAPRCRLSIQLSFKHTNPTTSIVGCAASSPFTIGNEFMISSAFKVRSFLHFLSFDIERLPNLTIQLPCWQVSNELNILNMCEKQYQRRIKIGVSYSFPTRRICPSTGGCLLVEYILIDFRLAYTSFRVLFINIQWQQLMLYMLNIGY